MNGAFEFADDHESAAQHVPRPKRPVVPAGNDETPFGVERDGVHLQLVPFEFEGEFVRRQVPEQDDVVHARPGEVPAGGVDGDGVHT